MKRSRTQNVLLNTSIALVCQLIYLLVSFICRTVFTKSLGAEYLGITGLFTNILTILSFAELGIGSALVFRMYEPLAKEDWNKVSQYIRLYKIAYRIILTIVICIGLILIPIIPYLVVTPNVKENIVLLYILYLGQTAVTYIFAYKKSLLIADQKSYIVNITTQIFNILMNVLQCIFLVFTHDFVIYCVCNIVCNVLNNIACSIYVDKNYSQLKKTVYGDLSTYEKKELLKDVKGLMLTKVASTAFSGTDNIFISAYIGIRYVGILSNYTLICNTVNSVMNKLFEAVTASIGNLAVTGEKGKIEDVLKKLFFINTALYGYMCIGMILLLRPFVTTLWLDAEYDLAQSIILFTMIELFLRSIHYPLYITRNALGCFSEYKIIFVIAAILNILLDFLLVKPLGILGLIIATIVCRGITYVTDIWVVYHIELKKSIWCYLQLIIKWGIFLIICGALLNAALQRISLNTLLGFILKCAWITFGYTFMFILTFRKSAEFIFYKEFVEKEIKEKLRL